MIGARLFTLQISNGDLSEMILVLQILSSSPHAGKKFFLTIQCLFDQHNQYFEPCLNHVLFETLDIFSCVAVKCFFSAVQQT